MQSEKPIPGGKNMRKNPILIAIAILWLGSVCVFGQAADKAIDVQFSPQQVESMLFLYNQTPVKGADVEIVAPVGAKLRAGLKQARLQQDSTKAIGVPLLPAEIQVCLSIINASTFEAKYAELVLGMKRKLESLLPPVASAVEKAAGGTKGERK
jgi:hypothetical protein